MNDINEINKKLDSLYEEYKQNKSQLNGEKTKEAARLLMKLTEDNNVSGIAEQLSRFSAEVVRAYFAILTKGAELPIDKIDEIIIEFWHTDKDASKSQFFVQKFVYIISSVMKNYKDQSFRSSQLQRLVAFVARFAVKTEKNRNKFQNLVNITDGGIYSLDYSGIKESSLKNIWNVTNSIYPDLTKCKYESFVADWGKEYGFIPKIEEKTQTAEPESVKTQPSQAPDPALEAVIPEAPAELPKDTSVSQNKEESEPQFPAPEIQPENKRNAESALQSIYDSLKSDIAKEQETIISAVADIIFPVSKTLASFQGEIAKSRAFGADNAILKARAEDLERQLSAQRTRMQEADNTLRQVRAEKDELKKQVAELDSKLNEAYSLNSRESSLEAEKIRSDLNKTFTYVYDDWREYEKSQVSEDNYESLQAIIKKIFRSLDKNGIDYKGNK